MLVPVRLTTTMAKEEVYSRAVNVIFAGGKRRRLLGDGIRHFEWNEVLGVREARLLVGVKVSALSSPQ